jgi:hypothetical protein
VVASRHEDASPDEYLPSEVRFSCAIIFAGTRAAAGKATNFLRVGVTFRGSTI